MLTPIGLSQMQPLPVGECNKCNITMYSDDLVSWARLSYPKREKESGESCTRQLYCAVVFGCTTF